ncbi:PREDICTED: granzyme B(G,H)-like [Condylura cristata]|uniref:granzyme B(G,H)-like n=1 Tax=Condylura cristata TaxID=143302 RepID=UPI0003343B69|nr:PREDICTED: granzyme B(G,H)-like [Condylura cristata]
MQPLLLPLLLACLLPPRTEAGEIIGGHEAIPHSRPYMAFLRISVQNSESWFGEKLPFKTNKCGGFLVREDFVLTAAHCNGRAITVILGAHDISKKERTQQVIPVKRAIPHPDYNNKTFANDIMLLQLQRKAKKNPAVKPLSLPRRSDQLKPGQVCSVAGWGKNQQRILPDTLQEVNLTIQADETCKQLYSKYEITSQLCAGDPKKNRASFQGDSGGPLVCKKKAMGIVAYGFSNGKPPRVYTKVSKFLPWIKETMRSLNL